ncbi:MAG: hypothetical protein U0556_13745 [Dehalococcoidia bacterium]
MAGVSLPRSPALPLAAREATWRENMTTALLGLWTVLGLFLDGWAHENLGGLETFFTPWHGALYSGLAASILWNGWLVTKRWLAGARGRAAVPPGYLIGIVGLTLFGAGGFADLLWHSAFGIERSIDALLSPPHLAMFFGAVLGLTSPLRAAWAADDAEHQPDFLILLPVLLTTALLSSVVAFFFMYLSVFTNGEVSGSRLGARFTFADGMRTYNQQTGIASILVTNVVLFTPVLFLLRRWVLPAGATTLLVSLPAILVGAVRELAYWPAVLGVVVGALATELLLRLLQPSAGRMWRYRLFAALAPTLLWAFYFLAVWLTRGVVWTRELTLGLVIWTGLSGLALSVLIIPPPAGQPPRSA